jgi:hypothetical protein
MEATAPLALILAAHPRCRSTTTTDTTSSVLRPKGIKEVFVPLRLVLMNRECLQT